MTESVEPLVIDVVSDVVCPWCYLGKKRLEQAVAAEGGAVAIRWRPYQLDPTIPPGGMERRAYLKNKFGDDARLHSVHERLRALGAPLGIAFAFDRIERAPNTFDAHRLIRWASVTGAQDAVVDRLFALYFEQGRDIGDRNLLLDVGRQCGMDVDVVGKLYSDDADIEEVRAEIEQARKMGVTGVPFFVFASRFGVPGAQEVEVLETAIGQARKALAGIEAA